MFELDEELREFVESGVAVIVGTADRAKRPHVVMGWGPRVSASGDAVTVFVESSRASVALSDVEATGLVALTFASPVSYRSLQLKGTCKVAGVANEEDQAWIQRHRDRFSTETALVGDPPMTIRNLMMRDVMMRFDMRVERAFDQTPGPVAGNEL
jgi:hypothetical protein